MPVTTADTIKIPLRGDWSMNGVTHQIPHLVEHLESLGEYLSNQAPETPAEPEIVLSGIEEFDACGCQLLALFVHQLKQKVGVPLLTGTPDRIKEQIIFLGLANLLRSDSEAAQESL